MFACCKFCCVHLAIFGNNFLLSTYNEEDEEREVNKFDLFPLINKEDQKSFESNNKEEEKYHSTIAFRIVFVTLPLPLRTHATSQLTKKELTCIEL